MKVGLAAALETLSGAHTPADGAGDDGGGGDRGVQGDELDAERGLAGDVAQLGLFGAEPIRPGGTVPTRTGVAGRPVGSTNKRTGKIGEYILALGYRHPALILADLANVDPKRLREFGMKPAEAMQLKRQAATDLMPYFESKMPVAVTATDADGLPVFVMGEMTPGGTVIDGAMGMADPVPEPATEDEKNQGVTEGATVRPEDEGSHDAG